MMYYPMYFDPTYILVLIGVVICLIASAKMNSTFSRYSRGKESFRYDRKGCGRTDSSQRRPV